MSSFGQYDPPDPWEYDLSAISQFSLEYDPGMYSHYVGPGESQQGVAGMIGLTLDQVNHGYRNPFGPESTLSQVRTSFPCCPRQH
jgi:hypothetical protein